MDQKLFERRRRGVMQLMGDGIAIIPTHTEQMRNGDVIYPFRPDSDFYYLTQFPEPEAIAVLVPGRPEGEYILFCREKDPTKEMWDGKRVGLDDAKSQYGADETHSFDQLEEVLPKLLENCSQVFHCQGRYPEFDTKLFAWVNEIKFQSRRGVHAPAQFNDLTYILHEMRLFKRAPELRVMRRAARLAAAGHLAAMRVCKPGLYEYQVQAELEKVFRAGGSTSPAYPSIVASGPNACILHYIENNARCHDGDLILIDAGAELECYASDITRTFPVNGQFNGEQRCLYELVLAAQTAAIECVKPDAAWTEYHTAAVAVMTQGLIDEGLLKGSLEQALETQSYKRFYMHGTGHWLGMDVHDVGEYKVEEAWRVLEPGMVLTVEPGLYISPSDDVDERWHHIGIRIEDDVAVSKSGCEILSRDVPVGIDEIEAIMRDA